jgi:hypothetical protein
VVPQIHPDVQNANERDGLIADLIDDPMLARLDGSQPDPPAAECGSKKRIFEQPGGRGL